jgi:hypothetical protein
MLSTAQVIMNNNRVFATARNGTPKNPRGLPETLARLIVAQARHETGDYTSNAYKYNNAFGYSYVQGAVWQSGPAPVFEKGRQLAAYSSLENSTSEIVDWIYRRVMEGEFPVNLDSITTPEQYAQYLKNGGYYEAAVDSYANGIKRFFSKPDPIAGGEGWFLGAMALAAVGFFGYRYFKDKGKKKRKRSRYTFG